MSIFESAFITGEILERQKDGRTGELKYRVRGRSLGGASVEVIAKLAITGKTVAFSLCLANGDIILAG